MNQAINSKTRISQLIKADKQVIEALVSLSSNFKRLRNPILRKTLARRVTIGEAAQIGGVSAEAILDQLRGLGFQVEEADSENRNIEEDLDLNQVQQLPEEAFVELDVRPVIEAGRDPFPDIMETEKQVKAGQCLVIINSFKPLPLMEFFQKKGYACCCKQAGTDLFKAYFLKRREDEAQEYQNDPSVNEQANAFDQLLTRFEGNMEEVDVRFLEMPQPMMTILECLENLPRDKALYVYHKQVPHFLLPKLDDQGFRYAMKTIDEHNVKMLIRHA